MNDSTLTPVPRIVSERVITALLRRVPVCGTSAPARPGEAPGSPAERGPDRLIDLRCESCGPLFSVSSVFWRSLPADVAEIVQAHCPDCGSAPEMKVRMLDEAGRTVWSGLCVYVGREKA